MGLCMLFLEVYALRCSRSCSREIVDADPGEDLVILPFVMFVIRPVMKFLVDPGKQADRTIGDVVADSLGACTLLWKSANT